MGHVVYSNEQREWLRRHLDDANWAGVCEMFNKKFGRIATIGRLRALAYSMGLKKSYYHMKGCFAYSPTYMEWLKRNRPGRTAKELTTMFNTQFGCNQSWQNILSKLNYMGVKREKGYRVAPIGYERETNGTVYVKYRQGENPNTNWILKAKYVWMSAYGDIGKGEQIIFLDGDNHNFDLENLYKVSAFCFQYLQKNKWLFKGQAELQKIAIKWCECVEYIREHFNPQFTMREWARRERIHELY